MKSLKRMRYDTMNSWNNATAPAYNLKVYNVIDKKLQDKVYELMSAEGFYDNINLLISEFDRENEYIWQAGFNGRSGGYLVLYKGGKKENIIFKDEDFKKNNGYNGRVYEDGYGWKSYGEAKEAGLLNKKRIQPFSYPGKSVYDEEVPAKVLKAFRRLAIDIVKEAERTAKNYMVQEEEYVVIKKHNVLIAL